MELNREQIIKALECCLNDRPCKVKKTEDELREHIKLVRSIRDGYT